MPSTYDALPYHDQAFATAHPDRLAVIGRLHGIAAAPVTECRVLELGCGLGGHLLPMAAVLPNSTFVGVDLSARQIDEGNAVVERLGLRNVELRAEDLMDFEGAGAPFDYIICHGVYSWVPPSVQHRIMSLCAEHLTADGLVMISYNTFPGWHGNGAVRDVLRYGARGVDDPREQVARALEFLALVARSTFDADGPYAQVLRAAAARLPSEHPTYVFHEYLEEHNAPLRFEDFAARATTAGLRWVADAELRDPSADLNDESRDFLTSFADDAVRCEQILDYLGNRRFRRDVLCRAGAEVRRWPDPAGLAGMRLVGMAEPVSTAPDLEGGVTERFRNPSGRVLPTADPSLKSALVRLHGAGAAGLDFDLLAADRSATPELGRALLACAQNGFVSLHTHLPDIASTLPDRPRASAVVRWQAEEGKLVVDSRYRSLRLDALSAAVLAELDGSRTRSAVREAVNRRLRSGRLRIEGRSDGGRTISDGELRRVLDEVLQGLAGLGLLLE